MLVWLAPVESSVRHIWASTRLAVAIPAKAVFMELKVPVPMAFNTERWEQYDPLLKFTVENLLDARGYGGSWNSMVK